MKFVPLHVYSGYSFHKSGLKINQYVSACKKFGYEYIGLSDYTVLSGIPILVHEAKANDLKTIVGEDFIIDNLLTSIYVKNEEGYSNLLKLSNAYQHHELKYSLLRENNKGLFVILTIQNDGLKKSFLEDKELFAQKLAKITKGIESFYLGIDGYDEPKYVDEMREFAYEHSYKTIAFPSVKYLGKNDAIALKMVECLDSKATLSEKKASGNEYLPSPEEIAVFFTDNEVKATTELAEQVDFNFISSRGKLIKFDCPNGMTSDEYLKFLSIEGLKAKGNTTKEYAHRLSYELKVISKMGYADYFLIVHDYVDYARRSGIPVGPGRGSASGSLVSYALGITVPDPIKYNLLFERFLNVSRQTMPDIDVDFSDIDRDKIVQYIASKYGHDHVANILAVQTMGAKQALRDVGRIFNYENHEIEMFTKLIKDDGDDKLTLKEIYKKNKEFHDLVNNDNYYKEIISLASRIEGLPRQASLHAVGIVLNASPLEEAIPLSMDSSGALVEQFEKDYIEEQGFLKMDILALRNLTIVDECCKRLERRGIKLSLDNIPYEDEDAIKMIASGKTMGIFQLESVGMRNSIKDLKPTTFEDIVALLALYRPGPMQNIPLYGKRKEGKAKITYLSPALKEILAPTYGIIVYQEQIMQIASKMAGFSLGEADSFRRAISKKDSEKLAALRVSFVHGSVNNGYKQEEATNVFNLIYKFADYGFNRSHSLVYAILSCRMAYLKAHYPEEFYASILSNVGSDKANTVFAEMKSIGIKLRNPDINESELWFKQVGKTILFPLQFVMGVSQKIALNIISERNENGNFVDLYDFVLRMSQYKLSLAQLNALIDSGAFDSIEKSRASLRNNIVNALTYASFVSDSDGNMVIDTSLFAKPSFNRVEDDLLENLSKELKALGMMVSGSPLDGYKDEIDKVRPTPIAKIDLTRGETIKLVGIIRSSKKVKTKRGDTMAFISVYDDTGEIELPIFSSVLANIESSVLKRNNVVVIEGYYRTLRDEFSLTSIYNLVGKKDE